MRRHQGILEVKATPSALHDAGNAVLVQKQAHESVAANGRLAGLRNKTASELTTEERMALLEDYLHRQASQPPCVLSDEELDEGRWEYLKAKHLK